MLMSWHPDFILASSIPVGEETNSFGSDCHYTGNASVTRLT
jgi:hypothetical protein